MSEVRNGPDLRRSPFPATRLRTGNLPAPSCTCTCGNGHSLRFACPSTPATTTNEHPQHEPCSLSLAASPTTTADATTPHANGSIHHLGATLAKSTPSSRQPPTIINGTTAPLPNVYMPRPTTSVVVDQHHILLQNIRYECNTPARCEPQCSRGRIFRELEYVADGRGCTCRVPIRW